MTVMFTTSQAGFRGYADDAGLGSATPKAAQNTGWAQVVDENFRIRLLLQETAGAGGDFVPQLQYQLNAAGFINVTATSSVVRSSASPNVADDAATGSLLGGSGTFAAGAFDEVDGLSGTHTVAASGHTEVEFCVQILGADVADTDTVELRVLGKSNAATALDAYLQIPSITVNEGSADATATPAVIAVVVSVPDPGFPAAVSPATIQSTSAVADSWSLPATASTLAGAGDATATPATVAVAAAVPAPSVLGAAQPTPSTIAVAGAVPTPTVLVGGDATVVPSTIAAVASIPAATVLGTARTTPATIAVTSAVPTPTVLIAGDATVQPSTVAVAAAVPAPSILVGGSVAVQPATVAVAASVLAPTVQATARVAPSTVAATAAVPAPTLRSDRTVSPSTVSITVTIPAPTTRGSSVLVPATIAALAAVGAPSVFGGAVGEPVADPQAVLTDLPGEAVLTSVSGDAILTGVDG